MTNIDYMMLIILIQAVANLGAGMYLIWRA